MYAQVSKLLYFFGKWKFLLIFVNYIFIFLNQKIVHSIKYWSNMNIDKTNVLIILALLAGAVAVYFQYYKKDASVKTENFVTTGGMQNLGAIEYSNPIEYLPSQDSQEYLEAPDFAQLVEDSNYGEQSATEDAMRPFERLDTLADSYIPKIASRSLPFSQAAAKPLVSSYSVNLPRVNLKGKLFEMNLSEATRGSVYINYDPNVSLISKSRYQGSDSYNTGLFTSSFDSLHKKLSGSYRNMPMYTAGSGAASGSGGNQIDLIMDQ